MEGIFQFVPEKRLTMKEVKSHKYFEGAFADTDDIFFEMKKRGDDLEKYQQ